MAIQDRIKFRPSLSVRQINYLIEACRSDMGDATAMEVLKVLAPFKAKIDCDAIAPSYVGTGSKVALSKMGIDGISNDGVNANAIDNEFTRFDADMEKLLSDDTPYGQLLARYNKGETLDDNETFLALAYGLKHGLLDELQLVVAKDWGIVI